MGYTAVGVRRRWIAVLVGVGVLALFGTGEYLVIERLAPRPAVQAVSASELPLHDGIPVPERRTAAGAATAAQNYQIAGFRVAAGTLDAAAAAAVLLDRHASSAAAAVLAAPTQPRTELVRQRSTFAPVSAMVQTYNPDRADVQVWGVAAESSQLAPQWGATEDWGHSTISVIWDGIQWRVADQHFQPGPWPVRSDERLNSGRGDFSFRSHESSQGWTYVPES
ncbi:hypothetical protein [Amycolatopsis sp. GM8]|uniref:hypothetical protein n=1 Tax=Amycolatopsis sp. GM8 TaxID=2896530 RepID=UPI001F28B20B|nr:hypothetical protein [Amycolatopsis sp. GM8]